MAAKRPQDGAIVLELLTKRFGFTTTSDLTEYAVEQMVVDRLWEHADGGQDVLLSRLFLGVARYWLNTEFEETRPKGRNTISFIRFTLPHTPVLSDLRSRIWQRLFSLYEEVPRLQAEVLDVIEHYSRVGYRTSDAEVMSRDAVLLAEFIRKDLNPSDYVHCVIVRDLLDWFEQCEVPADGSISRVFTNDIFEVSRLLCDDGTEWREVGYGDYREMKRERLVEFLFGFTEDDFILLIERCTVIERKRRGNGVWRLEDSLVTILATAAERSLRVCETVLGAYFRIGDCFDIEPSAVVEKLLATLGRSDALKLLISHEYGRRERWLFAYYHLLPEYEVARGDLEALYSLYETAEEAHIPLPLSPLKGYRRLERRVIPRVVGVAPWSCREGRGTPPDRFAVQFKLYRG